MDVKDYFTREKQVFLYGGSVVTGLVLWMNHFIAFGTLSFWDAFPSHESSGLILIVFGFFGIFSKMFNFDYSENQKNKNNQKVIGRLINNIIKRLK